MTSICQNCGTSASRSTGHCPVCGGVCLRSGIWTANPGNPRSATPLLKSRIPGLEGTWMKFEGANPSGSFKDRVMSTLVTEAVEDGAPGAVVASSGNAAVAAASHCARAGLPLLVVVPERVPAPILDMVGLRGAAVLRVGEGPAAVHHLAKLVSERFQLPNLASTFGASGCEFACRSIGHEIADQMGERPIATAAASVSVGPVLLGAARGIIEAGRDSPRLVAGQAAGCAPIARAFSVGAKEVHPWEDPVETRATSIADRLTGYSSEATYFLNQVRASGGLVDATADEELQEIRGLLASHDGLDVELSSCAAVAALRRSKLGGSDAVCILTGSGVKETLTAPSQFSQHQNIDEFFLSTVGEETAMKEVQAWIHEYQS